MTLLNTINYDNIGNFTPNPALAVVIPATDAILGFEPKTGLSFAETFASSAGFTFAAALTEFVGGLVRQKDISVANSVMASNYASSLNLSWRAGGGSLTGTLNGVPTNVGGKIVCTGSQGVKYAYTTTAIETHKHIYTPNYTGSPPSNVNIMTSHNGVDNNDRFNLVQTSAGSTLRIQMNNDVGATVQALIVMGVDPGFVASTDYEIELVVDSVAGTIRLFIDGNLHATISPGAWSRGGISSFAHVGASTVVYDRGEGSYDDFIVFDNAQHTATYVPGYTIYNAESYAQDPISLPAFAYGGLGTMSSFVSMTATEVGVPHYTIDGDYHNGAAWVASDGSYAQSNTLADFNTNAATHSAGISSVVIQVIFPDGMIQNSVDDLTLNYSGEQYNTADPSLIINSGFKTTGIVSIVDTKITPANTDIKYIFCIAPSPFVSFTCKWNDGANWVTSDDTFAQANTIAEINAAIASFDLSLGYEIKLKPIFRSTDGIDTPTLTQAVISYNFFAAETDQTLCSVHGYIMDASDEPVEGAIVKYRITNKQEFDSSTILRDVIAITDSEGFHNADIIQLAVVDVEIEYKDLASSNKFTKKKKETLGEGIVIPALASEELNTLIP